MQKFHNTVYLLDFTPISIEEKGLYYLFGCLLVFITLFALNFSKASKQKLRKKVIAWALASFFIPLVFVLILSSVICNVTEGYVCMIQMAMIWIVVQPIIMILAQVALWFLIRRMNKS